MKRSVVILALLVSFAIPRCYSQSLTSGLLKEINLHLAEGIECKQLVLEKDRQISIQDSLLNEHADRSANYEKQILLLRENGQIAERQAKAAYQQLGQCERDKEQDHKDVVRLRKGRNTWRGIALIETVVLAGIVYLSIR